MVKRIAFLLYFVVFFYIVWGIRGEANPELMINISPFKTIGLYIDAYLYGYTTKLIIFSNLIGNIILFIPLGIFIYTYCFRVGLVTLMFLSIYIPIYIEIVQYLLHIAGYGTRSIDIDDVLLNMIGIWTGYIVVIIVRKIKRNK